VERLLDFIEKHKFALIGTVLFHFVIFLSTNFVTMKNPYHFDSGEEQLTEVEIETDAIEIDEELLEMLNQQNQLNNEPVFNLAADANDSRERSYENFSTQDIDQQVEAEAQALEQQFMNEWSERHAEGEDGFDQIDDLSDKRPDDFSKYDKGAVDNKGDKAFAGKVMVSFSLKDRDGHAIEIPGYTCNGSGRVVIDIKVDKSGNVRSAEFNPSLSSGATSCMIEKAKRYASRARFSYGQSGETNGTITYQFIGQ